jgi:hypothetical protein
LGEIPEAKKMKKILLVALLCVLAALAGCAHVYHVSIDAINTGQEISGKTFVIVPGNADTGAGDLQFREFARYLSRALASRGYMAARETQAPDIEIYLAYGLGSPQARVRSYTVPVWGQTGTDITTTEQTTGNRQGSTTTTTTNVTPEYGITGYATQEENYTTYPKFVEIDAYSVKNAKPGDRMEELWKTTIHAEGKRNELRHVFPILIAAAAKYLGGNTRQVIQVALTEDQPEVKLIKGGDE